MDDVTKANLIKAYNWVRPLQEQIFRRKLIEKSIELVEKQREELKEVNQQLLKQIARYKSNEQVFMYYYNYLNKYSDLFKHSSANFAAYADSFDFRLLANTYLQFYEAVEQTKRYYDEVCSKQYLDRVESINQRIQKIYARINKLKEGRSSPVYK